MVGESTYSIPVVHGIVVIPKKDVKGLQTAQLTFHFKDRDAVKKTIPLHSTFSNAQKKIAGSLVVFITCALVYFNVVN